MSLTGRAGRRLPRVGFRCGHGGDLLRAAGSLYDYRYRRSIYSFLLYSLTNSHPITSSPSRARASNSSWPPADDPTRGGEPSRLGGLGPTLPLNAPEGTGGKRGARARKSHVKRQRTCLRVRYTVFVSNLLISSRRAHNHNSHKYQPPLGLAKINEYIFGHHSIPLPYTVHTAPHAQLGP